MYRFVLLWLTSQDGATALLMAARGGQESVVSLLLDRGADMEACSNVRGQNSVGGLPFALVWK